MGFFIGFVYMGSFFHEMMESPTGIMTMKVWRGPSWPADRSYFRTKKQIHPRAPITSFWGNIKGIRCVDHVHYDGKKPDQVLRVANPVEDGMGICRGCTKASNCPLEQLAMKKWRTPDSLPEQMTMFRALDTTSEE